MKVKVKYTSTRKFMVTLDDPTLGNLKGEIRKFVETVYKDSVREAVIISLNGTDPLGGSDDASLQSLGVVPGDMLTVLAPSSNAGEGGEKPKPAPSEPHVSPQASVSGRSDQPSKPRMEKPRYLLEARDGELPTSLQDIMSECHPSSVSQAINLLVHLTMIECGFQLDGGSGPPQGWKEMVATFCYNSPAFLDFKCTLVLVTMGEVKQVLASFPQQESEIMVRLVMKDYIRDPARTSVCMEDLVRVSQLARTLRDRLLHPLQVSAHQALGVPAPWHLAGLPHELLLQIANLLDYRDILALRETSRRLQLAMDDDKLWQKLYKRDFMKLYDDIDHSSSVDWKARYREAIRRRKDWKKLEDEGLEYAIPGRYPTLPFLPYQPGHPYYPPGHPFPNVPNPLQPHPKPNPFYDPDSPYFSGEIPPMPGVYPDMPDPLGPLLPRRPRPSDPFQPSRPWNQRGPRFDYF